MLNTLAFFALVLYLSARFRKRFELMLPLVTLATLLTLTLLAMVGHLAWVDGLAYAVLAGIALALLLDLLTRRVKGRALAVYLLRFGLTPGLLCFTALALFFAWASEPMTVWWRDDLAHWGLQVKSLWYFGGLVDGSRVLNARFGDYPPGVQVLQWLTMHAQGQWSEQALYSTLFLTYAVFLLPLFSRLTWKKAYWLPLVFVFCVAFPTWGNVLSYVFLGIDTSLSLCFGYVLLTIWNHEKGDWLSLLAIALGLCGLFLIKQIGLLLALLAVGLFLVRRAEGGWRVVLALLAPVALAIVWLLFCKSMGLGGYNSQGVLDQVRAVFQGTYVPPENADGILPALWNALITRYSGEITLQTAAPLPLPLLFWLLALPLTPLALAAGKVYSWKAMRRVSVYLAVSGFVFVLSIYLSFFTTFYYETNVYTYDQQSNMVLLVERYLAPLLLGHGMLVLSLLIGAFAEKGFRAIKLPLAAAVALTALLAVSTNWAVMAEVLNPDRYFQNERSVGSEATVRDQETWGSALDGKTDARVMLDLDSTSDYVKELVYSFAPARFYLSTPENTASTEDAQAYLEAEGITNLICLEDGSDLGEAVAPLTEDGSLYSYTLYDVTVEDGQVSLSENLD